MIKWSKLREFNDFKGPEAQSHIQNKSGAETSVIPEADVVILGNHNKAMAS